MHISRVQIAECAIALPYILRLGSTEIRTRDYVLIRVETTSGLFGEAIGYPRGTPLFEVLSNMARQTIGGNAAMRREVMTRLEQRNIPGRAALTRGLSLFDIALWDIACKSAGQPLFRYLGGLRKQADVTAVAGYYMDRRSVADIVDEVAGLCDAGYGRVKIMLKGDDPDFDLRYAAAVSERAPGCVAADAHWSWTTVTEAKRLCRDLDTMGLNFLEDPFAASDWQFTHELQRELQTPIAAGEDVFGIRAFADLVPWYRDSARRCHHMRRYHGRHRSDPSGCGGRQDGVSARLRSSPYSSGMLVPKCRRSRGHSPEFRCRPFSFFAA